MKKQLAWIVGGGSVAAMALLTTIGGCSNNNNNGEDAGKDATGQDVMMGQDVANDQVVQDSGGADCHTVPQGVPFNGDAGPYCPYQLSADGGTLFGACGQGNHCCDFTSGSNPSTCEPLGTACTFEAGTNADFQCNVPGDCTAGQSCCMNASATLGQDTGCSYYFESKDHGTTCMQTCPGLQLCGQTSDCPNGKTCQPLYTLAVWLGVCN